MAAPEVELGPETLEVEKTWRAFAVHAQACADVEYACAVIAKRCRRPGLQSDAINPWHEFCCPAGQPLFAGWRLSVDVLRTAYREPRMAQP
jgi:hypothetical protein